MRDCILGVYREKYKERDLGLGLERQIMEFRGLEIQKVRFGIGF